MKDRAISVILIICALMMVSIIINSMSIRNEVNQSQKDLLNHLKLENVTFQHSIDSLSILRQKDVRILERLVEDRAQIDKKVRDLYGELKQISTKYDKVRIGVNDGNSRVIIDVLSNY